MFEENLEKKISWLRLICTESVGPITFKHLLAKFKTAESALENLPDFTNRLGRKNKITIPSSDWANEYIKKCKKNGVYLVASYENEYPKNLLNIVDNPPILHVKTNALSLLNQDMIAIV